MIGHGFCKEPRLTTAHSKRAGKSERVTAPSRGMADQLTRRSTRRSSEPDVSVRRRYRLIFKLGFLSFGTSRILKTLEETMASDEKPKSKRGFASMDPDKRREIAAKGGASVPNEKRSFAANRALAVLAGQKGGAATPSSKRAFSRDRALATSAGRAGGIASTREK